LPGSDKNKFRDNTHSRFDVIKSPSGECSLFRSERFVVVFTTYDGHLLGLTLGEHLDSMPFCIFYIYEVVEDPIGQKM